MENKHFMTVSFGRDVCKKNIVVIIVLMIGLCFVGLTIAPGYAHATSATKLSVTSAYSNDHVLYTAAGKTSKGKVVWRYKSARSNAAQYDALTARVSGRYVYIVDGTRIKKGKALLVKLKKTNGKKVFRKYVNGLQGASELTFDNNNLYAANVDGGHLVKISKTGKLKWAVKSQVGGGAYKVAVSKNGKKLTVRYEFGEYSSAVYSTKSGKVLSKKRFVW